MEIVIVVDGVEYPTVSDAAREFGVSSKTVGDYVRRGLIPEPPIVVYGLREVNVFPKDYMQHAHAELAEHRKRVRASRTKRT